MPLPCHEVVLDGSSILVKKGVVGRHVVEAKTGRLVEAKKVTKKTKVEMRRGQTIETETIVIKRVRTK